MSKTRVRRPSAVAPVAGDPLHIESSVASVEVTALGRKPLPAGHASGLSKVYVDVKVTHSAGCMMKLEFFANGTGGDGKEVDGRECLLHLHAEALPLLARVLTEAAEQFERRQLFALVAP